MRTVWITILALLVFVADGTSEERRVVGWKVGGVLSNLNGDGWKKWESVADVKLDNGFRKGFTAGVFARLGRNLMGLKLEQEILYVNKGSRVEFDAKTDPLSSERHRFVANYNLNYVEITLFAKYGFARVGSAVFNLEAGPLLAIKTKAKAKWSEIPEELRDDPGFNWSESEIANVKSTDFGVLIGAGVDLQLGDHIFVGDLRYTLGLQKVADDVTSSDVKVGEAVLINLNNGEGLDLKNGDIRLIIGILI